MLQPRRILVVDDSKLARMALKALLADIGGDDDIVEAADAEEAFSILERQDFGVIFLDYNMPGTDGIAAAGVIRRRLPGAAIALVTANAQDAILEAADRLSVRFIPKPVRRHDIALFLMGTGQTPHTS